MAAGNKQYIIRKHDLETIAGFRGSYVNGQAVGALEAGQQIMKINSDKDDVIVPNGTLGFIVSSIRGPNDTLEDPRHEGILYFVIWEKVPDTFVAVLDYKVHAL